MSQLGELLLRAMRAGSVGAAGFVVLVLGIELWKRWRFGGFDTMTRQDVAFFAILVLMFAGFLWLARAITRELRREGRSGG